MQPAKGLSVVIEALYLLFFISLACSFRAISSISIALLLVAGLIKSWSENKSFFNQNFKTAFLYGCLLLYLFYFLAVLFSSNKQEGWIDLQAKIGLALVPLAVCSAGFINDTVKKRLSLYFIIIVTAASLYCLARATVSYSQSGNLNFFFYHPLVHALKGHAVYFSVLVFIAVLLLIEASAKNDLISNKPLRIAVILFLSAFLFLLSSKLVTGFYFLYLLVYFMVLVKKGTVSRLFIISSLALLIAGSVIVLTTSNPVSKRFSDIMNGDLKVVNMDKFNQGMYFNGIQFRLLQWKFTGEILSESNSWWTGVGPGNAQHLLDQKYISSDMYTGEPSRGDHGFLGYNTHNQFLETVLKSGIVGLVVLLFICFTLIKTAWQKKNRLASFITALLLAWLFTESVLERQYGIIMFTFFPFFIWPGEK